MVPSLFMMQRFLFPGAIGCKPSFILVKRYNCSSQKNARLQDDRWIPTVGLEIHAQINSKSKLFSSAKNQFMAPPNSLVSNFDASIPGTLPVINKECVRKAVRTGLALNCKIQKTSFFDRKHYFYSDMPQGYQITQYKHPIAKNGYLHYPTADGSVVKRVKIEQIQLEQDSGKSMHEEGQVTLIDLNRAGVGLMEIVTAPEVSSAGDACAFLKELYGILMRIGTCNGKLAEGQFRVDANISIAQQKTKLGTRVEVKNISGFKHIHNVIEYEIKRQIRIVEEGGIVESETRAFDYETGFTVSMRDKEIKQDYRFMSEPNLPPLHVYDDSSVTSLSNPSSVINVDQERRNLPKLPADIRGHLIESFHLSFVEAEFLTNRNMENYFIEVMECAHNLNPTVVWNWIKMHVIAHMVEYNLSSIEECYVSARDLAALLLLLHNNEINAETAYLTFTTAIQTRQHPDKIVEENNWKMISDKETVTKLCEDAIATLQCTDAKALSGYDADKPKSKASKQAIKRVIMLVRKNTNDKIHTGVAKDVTMKLLNYKRTS
ncbi:aspartyl/glutamyl-tRNA(Asn/Gln) amidotransferase subunit B-like isoform X1 [Clavelina lepadiformis]|uniref:aspartyl/glutamyl-tRNA(Asn/Gln) amidotransferase subunit B-like isoform X1 n=1 Tax=Clavelina lepadiformis TaxID=159417 RepID=UPI00404194E3